MGCSSLSSEVIPYDDAGHSLLRKLRDGGGLGPQREGSHEEPDLEPGEVARLRGELVP